MLQLIQPLISVLIGIAMAIYGLVHAITRFPGSAAFAALVANLPAVTAVVLFVLGLLAIVAGVLLIVFGARKLRRRWRRFHQLARHVADQPGYGDEGWEQVYR